MASEKTGRSSAQRREDPPCRLECPWKGNRTSHCLGVLQLFTNLGEGPRLSCEVFRPWDKWAKQYRIIGCVCEREREKLIVAELNRSCHFALHLTSQATAFSAWASQGGSSPTAPDRDPRRSSGIVFPECQWFVLIQPPRGRGQDEIENLFLYYVISCRDCYIIGSRKSKGLGREVTLPTSWVITHSFIVKQQKPLSLP